MQIVEVRIIPQTTGVGQYVDVYLEINESNLGEDKDVFTNKENPEIYSGQEVGNI